MDEAVDGIVPTNTRSKTMKLAKMLIAVPEYNNNIHFTALYIRERSPNIKY